MTKTTENRRQQPVVSFVTASRNDNHGGDMTARMNMFVRALAQQCDRHGLRAELLLVEWNPPADRPSLADQLSWPDASSQLDIRIITVPREIHERYRYADRLPFYQMVAKNVGLRRARSEWLLATNVDILFSEELIGWLAAGKMEMGRAYRVDRFDVALPVPAIDGFDVARFLPRAAEKLVRANWRKGSIPLDDEQRRQAWRPWVFGNREMLHTNACGDFHLAHREDWASSGAYPELDLFSMHLDSLWSFSAHFAGVREQVLEPPLCIFHLEHQEGFTPETEGAMNAELKKRRLPRYSNENFSALAHRASLARRAIRLQETSWGLRGVPLPEASLVTASGKTDAGAKPAPKLSVVFVGRNDDHGGHMRERMQASLDSLRILAAEEGLPCELILVEWNPPADRPRLAEILDWPETPGVDLRIVELPRELHDALPNGGKVPLFQMIGKNVGARRARAPWVLFSNPDVLFNRAMVRLLAQADFDPKAFYRAARIDTDQRVLPSNLDPDEMASFCEQHAVRVHLNGNTSSLQGAELPPAPLPQGQLWTGELLAEGEGHPLFSNACGDFTMLHRSALHRLRGYPELPYWSIYIDGLLIHAALGAGLRQVVIDDPARMYHIEHGKGWAVDKSSFDVSVALDYSSAYLPWARALKAGSLPPVNPVDWGLAHVELPESSPRALRSQRSNQAVTLEES